MKGYKGFDKNLQCKGFQYEVGKTYELENKKMKMCSSGFHFCKKLSWIHDYYDLSDKKTRVCEVEALGVIEEDSKKCVTDKIKIVRELTKEEIESLKNEGMNNMGVANTGDSNTGNGNTGDSNTGDSNTGNGNAGDRNTGNWNTGDWNTGNGNTGDRNAGNRNIGDRNTGDWNTGDWNTGDWNTGNGNTGDRNAGNRNIGDRNTGDWNTGNWNTGDRNAGDWNTGDWNTGDWNAGNGNTGDRNAGDWNTGDWNTGDWNKTNRSAGVFCNEEPRMLMFNKPTDMSFEEWRDIEAYDILARRKKSEWINFENMTDEEKEKHLSAECCGGYLKELEYSKSSEEWWKQLTDEEKLTLFQLPNFDLEVFNDIMALSITEEEYKLIIKE